MAGTLHQNPLKELTALSRRTSQICKKTPPEKKRDREKTRKGKAKKVKRQEGWKMLL